MRSKGWYLVLALVVVALLWLLWEIQPKFLMNPEMSMDKRLMWVGIPVLTVLGGLVAWWHGGSVVPEKKPPSKVSVVASTEPASPRSEYVLEVIGLGVTLDKYRQGSLWNAIKQGHPYASIREQDSKKYPWSANDKNGLEGGREGDALENGIRFLPAYWPTPSFCALSSAVDPNDPSSETSPAVGMVGGATSSGMGWTLFVSAGWEEAERPDRLTNKVFEFFDEHPDVPYVVLSSGDGMYFRNLYRPPGTPPLTMDGHYIPLMPDASALLVLARRERVEAMRPFVFKDADHFKLRVPQLEKESFAFRLGMAFKDLQKAVPRPAGSHGRNPNVKEWLQASTEFSERDDIYPRTFSLIHQHKGPPKDYKPTPWFPLPWNTMQMDEFDRLPSLGYLHRPVFIKMVDEEGKPLKRKDQRARVLAKGWEEVLQTLPEAQRQVSPARVITATGGNTDTTVLLHGLLDQWAKQGGPELDSTKPDQWVNTDARLGNTGAATWFMQMGIGVMASYREGGISAAINFRDPNEASIVFVSPPSEEKRKTQQHPKGGDVLRHHATPAINPANYE